MQRNKRKLPLLARGFAALCAVLTVAAPMGALAVPALTVLHSFAGGPSDGSQPLGDLIADSKGNLYGTTFQGGADSVSGVVFKLTPGGTETVLHSFTSVSGGSLPHGGLIADSASNLYGATVRGGASGDGVVFKLTPGGTETVLHSFTIGTDGVSPNGGLIADSNGYLYGTTFQGGGSGCGGLGCGVVFKLSPGGTATVLHSFTGSDGALPNGGLTADTNGNLFGTTRQGGASGNGVVFKLSPGGSETVLYSFCSLPLCGDGAGPAAGLIADSNGNLYGTTGSGGAPGFGAAGGSGVVFKLSPGGSETVLYSFCSLPSCSDGVAPAAALIANSKGNLYGTTNAGGASNRGVVFKLTPGGTETVLYYFCSLPLCTDGMSPQAGLIADSNGNLFGTTRAGGALGQGTVFKLAGTGFEVEPFGAFSVKLAIYLDSNQNQDAFGLLSSFTLGGASNGIDPITEPVTLQVGTFSTTIPPGSFSKSPSGTYTFIGMINGVNMEAVIQPTGNRQFALEAAALKASLAGTANPVAVTLTIGDDSGTASVNALIF